MELDECVSCGAGLISVSDICPQCGWPENKPIKPAEPEEVPEVGSSSDLVECHLCDLQIELDEKSVRKKNFWFHDKCFEKIPIQETEVSQKIKPQPKEVKKQEFR